jgi:peptidoglycan/xylan/chitin deacetylase (PgdA/CDA1 family)
LSFSGLSKLLRPWLSGLGAIFCLHHVRPQNWRAGDFAPNYQLELTPEFLDSVIKLVKKRDYALISIDEAVSVLNSGKTPKGRFAVFTLDDGYKDNAQYAAPVFRAHNCPYAIYVAPGIVKADIGLWWRSLEQIIAHADQVYGFETKSASQKGQAFAAMSERARSLSEDEQRVWVASLCKSNSWDERTDCRNVAMDWAEIKEIAKDPLCTIGAHTIHHFAVKRLDAERAHEEMLKSKTEIESVLGTAVTTLAYPYGDEEQAGPRDFEIARDVGFSAALTTRKGVVTPAHINHMHALPRVMLSGRYQKTRRVETLIDGLPLVLNNRGRLLNVS